MAQHHLASLVGTAVQVAAALEARLEDVSAVRARPPGRQTQAQEDATREDVARCAENFERWALDLRTWANAVNAGPHTSDQDALVRARREVSLLIRRVDILRARSEDRFRSAHFMSDRKLARERLTQAMRLTQECIASLLNLATRIVATGVPESPIARMSRHFTDYLGSIAQDDRPTTRIGDLAVLWEYIQLNPAVQVHAGNNTDSGDGILYREKEDFDRARSVLESLVEVCTATWSTHQRPPGLASLPRYAKICVILRHIGFEPTIDEFLRRGWTDDHLPFQLHQLAEMDAAHRDGVPFSQYFGAEQYRVVPRPWLADIVDLYDREPSRFRPGHMYGQGNFGNVIKVQDVLTDEYFALKFNKSKEPHVQDYYMSEIMHLRKLSQNTHVIKLVKVFRRRGILNLVLQRGEESLHELLERYYANNMDSNTGRRAHDEMREVLPMAFGCLSRGLQYVHQNNIRHKDVKPHNIVREFAEVTEDHNFCWIDFGVAADFTNDINSHNQPQHKYVKRYAAPEVMRVADEPTATDSVTPLPESPTHGSTDGDDLVAGIGRKADVFSLGLVFLEVLSVLLGERYPKPDSPEPGTLQACHPYHEHITELNQWINRKVEELQSSRRLRRFRFLSIVLEECAHMIKHDTATRHSMDQVVYNLASGGIEGQIFCDECQSEMQHETEEDIPEPTQDTPESTQHALDRPQDVPEQTQEAEREDPNQQVTISTLRIGSKSRTWDQPRRPPEKRGSSPI